MPQATWRPWRLLASAKSLGLVDALLTAGSKRAAIILHVYIFNGQVDARANDAVRRALQGAQGCPLLDEFEYPFLRHLDVNALIAEHYGVHSRESLSQGLYRFGHHVCHL